MVIGVPKEIKTLENRVALTPGGVTSLVRRGHKVLVQQGAGVGSGLSDAEYQKAGAEIVSAQEAWAADLVVKVKEPIAEEYQYLRKGLILFTYLHLAADEPLTKALLAGGTTAIAYETVQLEDGSLPLLTPMSEVAGRMAPASVVILGGGIVGTNAAKIALGMGAQVTILDVSKARMQYLDDVFGGRVITLASTEANVAASIRHADLLIGAVLIPGAKAPKLVTREMLSTMKEGAVIVDVAVDQGGCVETIRPTTHAEPTYVVDGVVHYGVANMPGAVPRTSTFALTNQTLPYLLKLAEKGLDALREDAALLQGLNTHQGRLTCRGVAEAFGLPYLEPKAVL
ncbi:Alanine dehydrogenase 2 [Meiothermus taiwanensis]|uniref:Alanine dehydrogenase n=1 Tax=Meiothermus taiwanensis TaxID=172827 RepID=A0A399DWY6_9DEIN|nr:alanine dehydrogenase [Meiothermus taiwanensis]RIH75758.1 Alanine dehydrogenase 2 [Meiothermus taiwanensis]